MFIFDCAGHCWTGCRGNPPAVIFNLPSYDLQAALFLQAKGRRPVDSDGQEGDQVSFELNTQYVFT